MAENSPARHSAAQAWEHRGLSPAEAFTERKAAALAALGTFETRASPGLQQAREGRAKFRPSAASSSESATLPPSLCRAAGPGSPQTRMTSTLRAPRQV